MSVKGPSLRLSKRCHEVTMMTGMPTIRARILLAARLYSGLLRSATLAGLAGTLPPPSAGVKGAGTLLAAGRGDGGTPALRGVRLGGLGVEPAGADGEMEPEDGGIVGAAGAAGAV